MLFDTTTKSSFCQNSLDSYALNIRLQCYYAGMGKDAKTLSTDASLDYIVVIPYSSNITVVNNLLVPRLSVLSKMSLDAAVLFWQSHVDAKLVIIGETCYGFSLPNTAELMRDRAVHEHHVPHGSLILLDKTGNVCLNNTPLQVEGLASFLNDKQEARTIVVALRYHVKRILTHAKHYNLQAKYVAAEDILSEENKTGNYVQYLPYIAKTERSEKWLRVLSKVNPSGSIFNAIMKRNGPRVVDVTQTPEGELQFVSTFARTRLAEEGKKLKLRE